MFWHWASGRPDAWQTTSFRGGLGWKWPKLADASMALASKCLTADFLLAQMAWPILDSPTFVRSTKEGKGTKRKWRQGNARRLLILDDGYIVREFQLYIRECVGASFSRWRPRVRHRAASSSLCNSTSGCVLARGDVKRKRRPSVRPSAFYRRRLTNSPSSL